MSKYLVGKSTKEFNRKSAARQEPVIHEGCNTGQGEIGDSNMDIDQYLAPRDGPRQAKHLDRDEQ